MLLTRLFVDENVRRKYQQPFSVLTDCHSEHRSQSGDIFPRARRMFTFFAADLCLTATISQCFHLGSPFELFTGYFSRDKFTKTKFRDLGDFHSSAEQTSYTNVRMSERIKQSPTVDIWNSAEEVKHRLVYTKQTDLTTTWVSASWPLSVLMQQKTTAESAKRGIRKCS